MTQFMHAISCALLISAPVCFATAPLSESTTSTMNVSLNHFLATSCDTTGNLCTAVGKDESDANLLIYRSQDAGLTWSTPTVLPNAPNSSNTPEQDLATDIHCDGSGQRCLIISSARIRQDVVLLAYINVNAQQEWGRPAVLPLPKSNLQKEGRYIYAKLSCGYSGYSCVIAGTLRVGIDTVPLLYTTKDSGYKWALVTSLKEPWYTRTNGISLYNVHCDNSGFLCKAIGYALTRNSFWSNYYTSKPVVYTTEDGGAYWNAPVILPSEIDGGQKASVLNEITCDGTGLQCMVIGFTTDIEADKNRTFSFATNNGGINWGKRQWVNSDYSNELFSAVDCDDSMRNCHTVGHEKKMISPGGFYLRSLIYSTTPPIQAWEKNTSQQFSGFSYLTDIFCAKYTSQCLVVGVQAMGKAGIRSHVSSSLLPKPLTVMEPKS